MANSVDPDQTAPTVCSGSTLFASILNSSADDFSRQHFQIFFLAPLGLIYKGLIIVSLMEGPTLTIGRIHSELKGCWVVIYNFIQILKGHSVSKQ